MTMTAEQVRVGQTGHIWTAPVGTAPPATIDTAPAADWEDQGYSTPDGVAFTISKETKNLHAWQTRDVIRRIVTGEPKSVGFTLIQLGVPQWKLAIGGGTVTSDGAGGFEYTPPEPGSRDERALIVQFEDGAVKYRLIYARAENEAGLDTSITAEDSVNLPVTMVVMAAPDGGRSWFLQTNDPEWTADAAPAPAV